MRRVVAERRDAGFTLIEAMASVAVTAAIVAALAMIAGQWLPRWGHGVAKLQRADLLSLGVERIVADIAAAEYVSANGDSDVPLFDGQPSSITFVRSAIGPDSPSRLETVRIAETVDDHRPAAIRFAAPFTPLRARGAPASGRRSRCPHQSALPRLVCLRWRGQALDGCVGRKQTAS